MKSYTGKITALVFAFLFITFFSIAQNTNQNQINNTVPHNNNSTTPTQNTSPNVNQNNNAGSTNDQFNNNPSISVPVDSLNYPSSRDSVENTASPRHDALQEERHILHLSGQNQVIIPPNAAGPDRSIRQIPQAGRNINYPDTTRRTEDQKQVNPTIMGSPTDSVK